MLRVGAGRTRSSGPGKRQAGREIGSGADWVVSAQDGRADEVLAEVADVLDADVSPLVRVQALYAQAIALRVLGRVREATEAARTLTALCRDLSLPVSGLRVRSLLADLLRCDGQVEQALEQLAHAVALESGLSDVGDPEVQVALGALAVALRLSGLAEESRRVELRLEPVEADLPEHQRISRASNQAMEHAIAAMAAARRTPPRPDGALLRQAVAEIEHAERIAGGSSYHVVAEEAAVLRALLAAVETDAPAALAHLDGCRAVLDRGPEAVAAQNLWATARVHVLLRLGRADDAMAEGRALLESVEPTRYGADRLVLAYEVMRAEEAGQGGSAAGARTFLALAEERTRQDAALVTSLFRARVALLRSLDERRLLARAASLDSLTGLVNRRGAAAAIAAAAGRADPVGIALLLVDLDGFKRVNDLCGHVAGDVVLQRVAGVLRSLSRPEDVVARWSGDEFVMVAPVDAAAAMTLGERIRDAVRDSAEPGADDAVTVSVGVAMRSEPVPDDEWLSRAELGLYAARRRGGDTAAMG